MSNEEAIEMLEALLDPEPYDQKLSKKVEEAVKVAIEALKERIDPCAGCIDHRCNSNCPVYNKWIREH